MAGTATSGRMKSSGSSRIRLACGIVPSFQRGGVKGKPWDVRDCDQTPGDTDAKEIALDAFRFRKSFTTRSRGEAMRIRGVTSDRNWG